MNRHAAYRSGVCAWCARGWWRCGRSSHPLFTHAVPCLACDQQTHCRACQCPIARAWLRAAGGEWWSALG
eukprot:9627203-Alexandrium_andersonii.AAC.1